MPVLDAHQGHAVPVQADAAAAVEEIHSALRIADLAFDVNCWWR